MKKSIIYAALAVVMAGSFISCESNVQRVENAEENLLAAEQELEDAKQALNAEYPAFRIEAEAKIVANEKRIEELNTIIIQPGDRKLDELRRQRIEELKLKNTNLRIKLSTYEKENSDWEVFKRDFNNELNGIIDAIKDLGTSK
jgi:hypothetical protein